MYDSYVPSKLATSNIRDEIPNIWRMPASTILFWIFISHEKVNKNLSKDYLLVNIYLSSLIMSIKRLKIAHPQVHKQKIGHFWDPLGYAWEGS